jgi:hypothetical protein
MWERVKGDARRCVKRDASDSGVASRILFLFPLSWVLVMCGIFVITSVQTDAQINTATLTGTVTDASGAAVPDAEVSVQSVATGVARTTKTNGTGEYVIPSLAPGSYEIDVSKDGFGTLRQTGVLLQVAQTANVNATLQVSGTKQAVEVVANAQAIETSNATLGTVIQQQEVVDLPLNGRQFTQLLELAPGTVPVDQSQNNGKGPNFGAGAPTPAVNGSSNRDNLFFVDGIFASNPFFTGFSLSPSIDAIQEFKEQTHSDLAEYGQSTGAIVSVVTKSGTNQFHGSAFEFFRNGHLDARNTFSAEKLPYHQNQFGGTFAGPILRNRLFFFLNYEGGRQVQPQPAYSIVPTAAERTGNFSGTNQIIYDPATYNPVTQTETPFKNNVIPASRIDPQMQTYLNGTYPIANTQVGNYNFLANTANAATQDQGNGRIDYNLGSKDILFGRFSQGEAYNSSPSSLLTIFQTGFNGKNAGINWIHTFSATTVSQITFAYSSLDIPQIYILPENQGTLFTASGLGAGFNQFPGSTAGPQVPSENFNSEPGVQAYSGWYNGAGPIGPMSTGQLSGSVSKVVGSHNLKFGAVAYKSWVHSNWNGNGENFSYKGTWNAACQYATGNAAAAAQCPGGLSSAGGDPVASMLLSLPVSATRNLGDSGVRLRFSTPGIFVQDTWKITPRLTLNYGLRWDYSSPVTEAFNRLPTYDIYTHTYLLESGDRDAPSTLPANVAYSGRNSITSPHWGDFSPRLGLAYQVTPKTVIRAGFGRTFDIWAISAQTSQSSRGGWPSGLAQIASTQDLNAQGISTKPDGTVYTGENPFFGPATIAASPLPAGGSGFQDVRWQPDSSFQWNIEVQRDLGGIGTASVAYVGSQTEHVNLVIPYNLAPASTNPIKVYPDPIFGAPGNDYTSNGTARYDSLQARLTRLFRNGFTYNAAFTWERAQSQAVCGDFFAGCVQNPYNIAADYGPTALDIPLIFTFNSVYQLPFGKAKKYLTSGSSAAILGNWQINGIFSARSGLPFNPCCAADVANAGGGSQRYNLVGDPYLRQGWTWFNPAAFVVPASGTYATTGVNSLRGPHYWDTDFSVFRDFPFTESMKLQFRAEFFNIFNHPNYSNPSCYNCDITSTTGQGNRDIQLVLKLLF